MKKYFIPFGVILIMAFNSIALAVDEIPPGGFDYNNNKQGFSIVLPAGWDDYTVTEETLADETYFDFFLPTTDTSDDYPGGTVLLFTITATTGDDIEMAEYLGANDIYDFYFSHLNGFPPDDLTEQVKDFDQIKSTFTAYNKYTVPELGAFYDTMHSEYDDAIWYVKDEGIVEGYADGTYKPDSPINRAEFTKILMEYNYGIMVDETNQCHQTYNAGLNACAGDGECGLPVWEEFAECIYLDVASNITDDEWDALLEYDTCFPDVPKTQWFAKYVCLAKAEEIIGGYPDGNFKPANNINLAEALKILFETRAVVESTTITATAEGEWYQVYMNMANNEQLLGTINADPAHLLTRGEMAELIYLMAAVG